MILSYTFSYKRGFLYGLTPCRRVRAKIDFKSPDKTKTLQKKELATFE